MITSAVTSSAPGNTAPTTVQKQLKTEDFIKMMITQLQNQDPMQPTKNEELMAQMAQISQLQASSQLQSTLKTLTTQNQIGSAGNLIGKMVAGLDENQQKVTGLVTSVQVDSDGVYVSLDNGNRLALQNVTAIAPPSAGTSGGLNLWGQNQIASASNLIGKMVSGVDEKNNKISGLVTSVRADTSGITLALDNGKSLALDNVTAIAQGSSS